MNRLSLSVLGCLLLACNPIADHIVFDAGFKDSAVLPLDAGVDAGPKEPEEPKGPWVLDTGAPCKKAKDCEGPKPICQTSISMPSLGGMGEEPMTVEFPDGYCTADCTSQEQCAVGAECGIKKLIDTIKPFLMGMNIPDGLLDQIPSQCLDRCSAVSQCREGYLCQSLIEASGQASRLPAGAGLLFSKYCLPPFMIPSFEGGVGPSLR